MGWRRTARLKEPQKLDQKHCLVSASLRLRCRSATFSRAWGNLVKTRKRVLTISLFRRRRASSPTGGYCARAARARPQDVLLPASTPFSVRALAEILLEQFTIVLTISFSSNRARSSFVPPRTVPFVNKRNRKNFRRMLTHPKAAGGPTLFVRARWAKGRRYRNQTPKVSPTQPATRNSTTIKKFSRRTFKVRRENYNHSAKQAIATTTY